MSYEPFNKNHARKVCAEMVGKKEGRKTKIELKINSRFNVKRLVGKKYRARRGKEKVITTAC